jgi:hypothetical protein
MVGSVSAEFPFNIQSRFTIIPKVAGVDTGYGIK